METHRLVLPADLNQYGFLFGGQLLSWIDEASWIAASLDYPDCHFVTVGMDRVEFRHSVREGTILTILSEPVREGMTSVTYGVTVSRGKCDSGEVLFSTNITFVNVDASGAKVALCAKREE
jgi:acyl-CoA hydrolase